MSSLADELICLLCSCETIFLLRSMLSTVCVDNLGPMTAFSYYKQLASMGRCRDGEETTSSLQDILPAGAAASNLC